MEKREVAPYVYLTDEQYERLHERYGKDHLEKRIQQLSKKKQNGEKPLELSDYHSLRTKGMQLVEPIRNRDDIQLMKRILKRDSLRNYFFVFPRPKYRNAD